MEAARNFSTMAAASSLSCGRTAEIAGAADIEETGSLVDDAFQPIIFLLPATLVAQIARFTFQRALALCLENRHSCFSRQISLDNCAAGALACALRGTRRKFHRQVSSEVSPMPPKTCVALLCRLLGIAATVMIAGAALPAAAQDSVKLGLVAAMSGQSAKSGEAIVWVSRSPSTRSMRRVACSARDRAPLVRDDESNPAKGVVAARESSARRSRPSSAVSILRYRSPLYPSPMRPKCRSWGYGRRAPRSPAMVRRTTTCSGFPRSTTWSMSRSWITH